MKTLRIAIAALLVLAVGALAGIGRPEAADASEDVREGITVTGTGSVEAAPDTAQLSLGVTTRGRTAKDSMNSNATRMRAVIAAIEAAGVARRDIQTNDVSAYPDMDESGSYTVSNSVSVRVRGLGRASAILEAATQAGANQVSGPALTREDRNGLEEKALKAAVGDARRRAEVLAEAAGVDLGRVIAITESPGGGPMPLAMELAARDSAAPIEPGIQEIQATVTVTFAID